MCLNRPQEKGQPFSLSDNAIIGPERLHDFPREQGESAPPQDQQGIALFSDGSCQLPVFGHVAFWGSDVAIIDISKGKSDNVRLKLMDFLDQSITVFHLIHIRKPDLMLRRQGVGHIIKAQRIYGIGYLQPIGRDKEYLHCIT